MGLGEGDLGREERVRLSWKTRPAPLAGATFPFCNS